MTSAGTPFDDAEPPPEPLDALDNVPGEPADALAGALRAPAEALAEALAEDEQPRGVTTDDLLESIVRSQRASKLRLGDILKDMGLATEEQITTALSRQKDTRKRLGQLLIDDGVLSELDLAKALASKFGVNFLDLSDTHPEPAAAGYIDEKLARRYGAAPIRFLDDNTLLVAMVDPQNLLALQDLEIITGFTIQPAIASEEDIYGAIAAIYRDRPQIDGSSVEDAAFEEATGDLADIRDATEEAPIIKLVNSVIAQSVDDGASDIHFEPQAKELMIRFRVDGVLHEVMSIPRRMQAGVISRLKIMAELDIAERRVPQDGRIGLMVGGKPIDMRVATLPTVYGEKI
ncbi:MAG TPA: ATPase, T2SS/T4P/T4SS family, partial [Thermoleophilia bacterium]